MMCKKTGRRILQGLPYFFLALAILLIVQLIVAIKNDRTPTLFGYSIFLVVSPSMEDTIMTGDLIFVDTQAEDYNVGDIITFHQPTDEGVLITHRIVSIDDSGAVVLYTTQGDNNYTSLAFEKDFPGSYIVGKYVGKSSLLGNVYSYVSAGGIHLIYGAVVGIFLLIGISEAANIVKEITKANKLKYEEEKQRRVDEMMNQLRENQTDKEDKE